MITKKQIRDYIGMDNTQKSFFTDLFIMSLIFLTSIFYIIETYPISAEFLNILQKIDVAIMIFFSLEFLARAWIAKSKKRFSRSPYTWIDFLTVIPFWIGAAHSQFFRVLRFFRLLRYSRKYLKFTRKQKSVELLFVSRVAFTILVILFVSSAAFYEVENEANPKVNDFDDAFYFTLVTVTTVGYGDIVPVTQLGHFVIILVILSGVIFIPYQIGSLFRFMNSHHHKTRITCKSCGLRYHDYNASHCKGCGHVLYHEHDD